MFYINIILLYKSIKNTISNKIVRLWGMGRGLGRGLGTNAQVTTPGGLGFGCGPLGGGFSLCVGHAWRSYVAGSYSFVG
ncbi:hypothetical protein HanIR_Chr12g0566701 [Helianthus annuus]|nr:hypothetical protein HanIR_Chr12g0566701 [Helianthus annuus]